MVEGSGWPVGRLSKIIHTPNPMRRIPRSSLMMGCGVFVIIEGIIPLLSLLIPFFSFEY
jgi:hypothetical protein